MAARETTGVRGVWDHEQWHPLPDDILNLGLGTLHQPLAHCPSGLELLGFALPGSNALLLQSQLLLTLHNSNNRGNRHIARGRSSYA